MNYRLQDGVPQTIEAMREAGIKVSPVENISLIRHLSI